MTCCDLVPFTTERTVIITGEPGGGKTETAINLALSAARSGLAASIVDLDTVTPLFRSRDAAAAVIGAGVNVLTPPAELTGSDLPLVPRQISRALETPHSFVVFDCGGGGMGARAMASVRKLVSADHCDVLAVVNPYRPFFDSTDLPHAWTILQEQSKFTVRGIVSNPHLGRDTTADEVLAGHQWVCREAAVAGYDVRCLAAVASTAAELENKVTVPVLVLELFMVPPWSLQ